jgi:hypothetical protein
MGMFDHVTCELPMPDGREVVKDSFQTKSLWCCMDLFTITAAGRLIFHKRRYSTSRMSAHVADIDMDYHGDLEIHGSALDDAYARYAVRFTHGAVEWIRPLDALPQLHRFWLMERG